VPAVVKERGGKGDHAGDFVRTLSGENERKHGTERQSADHEWNAFAFRARARGVKVYASAMQQFPPRRTREPHKRLTVTRKPRAFDADRCAAVNEVGDICEFRRGSRQPMQQEEPAIRILLEHDLIAGLRDRTSVSEPGPLDLHCTLRANSATFLPTEP